MVPFPRSPRRKSRAGEGREHIAFLRGFSGAACERRSLVGYRLSPARGSRRHGRRVEWEAAGGQAQDHGQARREPLPQHKSVAVSARAAPARRTCAPCAPRVLRPRRIHLTPRAPRPTQDARGATSPKMGALPGQQPRRVLDLEAMVGAPAVGAMEVLGAQLAQEGRAAAGGRGIARVRAADTREPPGPERHSLPECVKLGRA